MSFDDIRVRLVDRRKSTGRTQADVARDMGTTQSAVSDLESGRTRDPRLNTLARWANALDLTFAVHPAEVITTTKRIVPTDDGEDA